MGAGVYEFDGWIVDLDQRTLVRKGVTVALQPRTFDLLAYFVTHPGTLLTKETLLGDVWRGVVVTDNSLTRSVRQLRVALKDTGEEHRYLETAPRTGYRFIADVQPVPPRSVQASSRARFARGRRTWLLTAAMSLVGLTLVWVVRPVPIGFTSDEDTTIAVLPFVSLSGNRRDELFSDGISEEILNELARYRELKVIARTSSFAFKDARYDVPRLAGLLDADYLLQGSLRRDGVILRLSVQLIDQKGVQVWSQAYDREAGAIIEVQKEIASAVVGNIAPRLTPGEREGKAPDPDAYRHYVIGREIVASRQPNAIYLAPRHLRRALEVDPYYPEALAELAVALTLGAGWVPELYTQFDEAHDTIARALELRPNLPRAHAARGLLLSMVQAPDLTGSERALRRAIELDPNHVDALNWLGGVFKEQGRLREAFDLLEAAARLDPLAPHINSNLALSLAERGDFTLAEHHLRRLLEVPRPGVMARHDLARIHVWQGRPLDAVFQAREAALTILSDGSGSSDGSLPASVESGYLALPGAIYAGLGMWDEAHRWHDLVERRFPHALTAPLLRATTMRRQGRYAEMLDTYRRVIDRDTYPSSLSDHYRMDYGILLALSGDHAAVLEVLKPAAMAEKGALSPTAIWARHALAWALAESGRRSRASEMLGVQERHFQHMQDEGFLHLPDDLMLFAQNALLAGDVELAVLRLRAAVEAGWRDYHLITANPWWDSARRDPRVAGLMARVKADVDRQRSILETVVGDEIDRALPEELSQMAPAGPRLDSTPTAKQLASRGRTRNCGCAA